MSLIEGIDDLGVYDDGLLNDEIRPELADEMFFVVNWIFGLLLKMNSLFREFDIECIFIKFFIEPKLMLLPFFLWFKKLCFPQSLVEVSEDVIDVLDAYGEADELRLDASGELLLGVEL